MAQMIASQNVNGIVLAAENMALQLDDTGKEISFLMNRLLPLTSHAALMTAGAAEGVEMGKALKIFIEGEKVNDVQELYGATLAFLSTEYERFMRRKCEILPIDPIHQSPLSWPEERRRIRQGRSGFTFCGQRRSFPSLMEMKSLMPSPFQGGWVWNFISIRSAKRMRLFERLPTE